MMNQDMLDAITLISFIVGIQNYKENLSQSDKDDLMRRFDEQTNEILEKLTEEIEKQNRMLEEILKELKEKRI